jgi:hypothetical protein
MVVHLNASKTLTSTRLGDLPGKPPDSRYRSAVHGAALAESSSKPGKPGSPKKAAWSRPEHGITGMYPNNGEIADARYAMCSERVSCRMPARRSASTRHDPGTTN